MARTAIALALGEGLARAGLDSSDAEREALLAYLELLARWNRKVNLTAFDLTRPTDAAIDRLVIEPLAAATLVRASDRVALDIGSGGGSPAIPLALRCRQLTMTMVEARQRKASFLREAVRVVGLQASVEARPFEEVSAVIAAGSVDVATVRAVRLEERLFAGIDRVLATDGAVVLFGIGDMPEYQFAWTAVSVNRLGFVVGRKR